MSVPPGRNFRRLFFALFCGALGLAAGVWAQRFFWPAGRARASTAAEPAVNSAFPAAADLPPSKIDWKNPPLPAGARVVFPLVQESSLGLKAQYLCETAAAPETVREFYRSQLARDGWTLYNGRVGAADGAGSLLLYRYSEGRRWQFWLTVFNAKDGKTSFRISVLPRE